MAEPEELLALVDARQGHFRLESGLHSRTWLDLDPLFADPARVAPHVGALAALLREHRPDAVCGPLVGGAFLAQAVARELGRGFLFTQPAEVPAEGLYRAVYHLPRGFRPHVRGRRIVVVDDAISAGSSVRATKAELESFGADVVAIGTLFLLGSRAAHHFAAEQVPLAAVTTMAFDLWTPVECPACAAGTPLDDPGD